MKKENIADHDLREFMAKKKVFTKPSPQKNIEDKYDEILIFMEERVHVLYLKQIKMDTKLDFILTAVKDLFEIKDNLKKTTKYSKFIARKIVDKKEDKITTCEQIDSAIAKNFEVQKSRGINLGRKRKDKSPKKEDIVIDPNSSQTETIKSSPTPQKSI